MKGKIMPIGVVISGADPLVSLEKVTWGQGTYRTDKKKGERKRD